MVFSGHSRASMIVSVTVEYIILSKLCYYGTPMNFHAPPESIVRSRPYVQAAKIKTVNASTNIPDSASHPVTAKPSMEKAIVASNAPKICRHRIG